MKTNKIVISVFSIAVLASVSAVALEKASDDSAVEWGTCPCVGAEGAWNKVLGLANQSAIVLESVDQVEAGLYARSTNNIVLDNNGGTSTVGELDIAIPSANQLQCSAYSFDGDYGLTSTHASKDTDLAVTDCRSGLFNLAERVLPQL